MIKKNGNLINDGIGDKISSNFLGLRDNREIIRNPLPGIGRGHDCGKSLEIPDILVHGFGSLLLSNCKHNMIHGIIVHVNLKGNLVPGWNNDIVDPSNEIVPALQLQRGQQPLTIPSPAGIKLERGLPFFQQQRGVVAAVADSQKAEILLENGVLGGELGSPGEGYVLILALAGEVIDGEDDEKSAADDLDGEGTRGVVEVLGFGVERGRIVSIIIMGGFGIR